MVAMTRFKFTERSTTFLIALLVVLLATRCLLFQNIFLLLYQELKEDSLLC